MAIKNAFLILAFITLCQPAFAQQTGYDKIISKFILDVRDNKVKEIAKETEYPFCREYPIPCINSEKEFISRYNQLFDDSLKKLIVNSKVHNDWKYMGWRGIMLFNGVLWLDTDGKLISIGYQSAFEKREWTRLVEAEKSKLYPGLKELKSPILFMETKKFKIRIDDLGEGTYRYAEWPISKTQSDKPDLILTDGKIEFDGSGGNHDYVFKKGNYTYTCYVAVMREEDSPPARITVLKDEQEILNEPALRIEGSH